VGAYPAVHLRPELVVQVASQVGVTVPLRQHALGALPAGGPGWQRRVGQCPITIFTARLEPASHPTALGCVLSFGTSARSTPTVLGCARGHLLRAPAPLEVPTAGSASICLGEDCLQGV